MRSSHPPLSRVISVWILLLSSAGAQPSAPLPFRDASRSIDARIADLVGRLTVEEKVMQLQAVRFASPQAFDAAGEFTGGAEAGRLAHGAGLVYAGANLDQTPRDLVRLARDNAAVQRYLRAHTRLGLPALTFAESLHGFMAAGATSFPQAIALGSTWDPALVEQVFTVAGREASAGGIRQVLSPVLDLARDARWGRFEECYGEDPYLAAQMALAAVRGLQGRGPLIDANHVAVTLKHFAGHGQPEGGRNIAPLDLTERIFRSQHLYPFEVAVREGHAHSVMASYNEWDGIPNHANPRLLIDILRGEWGFQGYVMSDGGGIDVLYRDHHAASGPAAAAALAVNAGVDYELDGRASAFLTLTDAVRNGTVPLAALDRAAAGVLRVKFLTGLFDLPPADPARVAESVRTPAALALARRAAGEAVVLLKNDRHLLPFDAARLKRLAVIGPNAADLHLGGYSAVPMTGISILDGLRAFAAGRFAVEFAEGCRLTANHASGWTVNENPIPADPADDEKRIDEAVQLALRSDAVVLALGENELLRREAWSETHLGDRDSLELVGRQQELARALLATGKPVAVLLVNGGPLALHGLANTAPAILECWYLGTETGAAVADVLFGAVNPSGKLTVTLPRSVGQIPVYYDRQPSRFREYVGSDSTPLYPFGHGLSYTTFSYDHLQVSPGVLPPDGTAEVSVEVANTGSAAGDEIVQLYLHAPVSFPVRPVQELKGFARLHLEPGERRTARFRLGPNELWTYDQAMRRVVAPGGLEVQVGGSSVSVLRFPLRISH